MFVTLRFLLALFALIRPYHEKGLWLFFKSHNVLQYVPITIFSTKTFYLNPVLQIDAIIV